MFYSYFICVLDDRAIMRPYCNVMGLSALSAACNIHLAISTSSLGPQNHLPTTLHFLLFFQPVFVSCYINCLWSVFKQTVESGFNFTRHVILQVAHAPRMLGAFSQPPWVSDLTRVSFEVGGGENVPGFPGACATRNFTYLERGLWCQHIRLSYWILVKE